MSNDLIVLDLDEELLAHLPNPDSWVVLRGESFKPQLLYDDFVREVYVWADNHYRDHGQPPTASVLSDEFDIDFIDPETAIGDLIDRLRLRYMNNEGRERVKKIVELVKENPAEVPKALLQQGKELTNLLNKHGEMFGTGDVERALQHYQEKTMQGPGPSLGFPELDEYFYGQKGITFFMGAPKRWKSWFMVNATIANVEDGKYPWLYSLELPAKETDMRTRCMVSGVPWWKYLKNSLDRKDKALLKEASSILDEKGVYRIVKPPQGERSIDDLVGRAMDAGANVVLIDQLQYVEIDGHSLGSWNETGKYFEVLDRARNLSDEIPICFAHQFNRETKYSDEMPSVDKAKGSASIEETATLVMGIWANADQRRSGVCEFGTLASRNHNFRTWEIGIDLSKQCKLEVIGVVEDD